MEIKYELPRFLQGTLTRHDYIAWLDLKADSHFERDRERFGTQLERSRANYKEDIHDAVKSSEGRDFYTGERLEWFRIGKYDSEEAQRRGVDYRREIALLPTVDHENPVSPDTELRICGMRTNDWKSDLTMERLLEICERFLRVQLTSPDPDSRECAERALAKLCEDLARGTTSTSCVAQSSIA